MTDNPQEVIKALAHHLAEASRLIRTLELGTSVGAQSAPPHDSDVIDPSDLLLIEEAARIRRCVPRTIERLAKRVPRLLVYVHGKPFIRRSVLLQPPASRGMTASVDDRQ